VENLFIRTGKKSAEIFTFTFSKQFVEKKILTP